MTFTSHSPEQTKKIAADFVKNLRGGEVVTLEGELGSGKTTFVQGLAEALGAQGPVRSPSFTIMNIYRVPKGNIREVVHLDCYRLKRPEEIRELGLEEWLGKKGVLVMVEWPTMVPDVAWKPTRTLRFTYGQGDDRVIEIAPDLPTGRQAARNAVSTD